MKTIPPEPTGWGSLNVEPFSSYIKRWPKDLDQVPREVIETWVYRHWGDFLDWLPLQPFGWRYEEQSLSNDEILCISHVGDWPATLEDWGNDLIDGSAHKSSWLGQYMQENGTTPAPIIIAKNAGKFIHPRERGEHMVEPYQLIEGHMRLAYLQAMIRRTPSSTKQSHRVLVASILENDSLI